MRKNVRVLRVESKTATLARLGTERQKLAIWIVGISFRMNLRCANLGLARLVPERKKMGSWDVGNHYMGIALIRNRVPLGPYRSILTRALWWPSGGGAG